MNTFFIFAVCLTAAYVIYYTVIICTDLYGKPKERRDSSEESFELSDMQPEASRLVEETDGGFRVATGGSDESSPDWTDTVIHQAEISDTETKVTEDSGPKFDAHGVPATPAGVKIDKVNSRMEEIETEQSGEMAYAFLSDAMLSSTSTVPIDKTVIPGTGGQTKEQEDGDGTTKRL